MIMILILRKSLFNRKGRKAIKFIDDDIKLPGPNVQCLLIIKTGCFICTFIFRLCFFLCALSVLFLCDLCG